MNVMEMFSLKGKTAILTGGAGLYGRQILEALVEAGAETFIASRDVEALEKIAAEYRRSGASVTALRFDQGDPASIEALRDEVLSRAGKIDILINNAVSRPVKNGWVCSFEELESSMRINGTGLILLTRVIGDVMAGQKRGSIVNIGSMMGMVGVEPANYAGTDMNPKGAPPDYFFHKGGMINFTRYCASMLGGDNVRVNCVSPGGFNTPDQPERFVRQYSARTQLGRMANSTDLKGTIVFLASDASAYITGANIPVDGGYTAK